ncbi:MAG: FHA domain-containing protein [Planctomycetota bacterium]|jgi:pSer/pThr/pTyr-binding forkhead associated (FHA) protein
MDVNLVLFKKGGSQKAFSLPDSTTVIGRRHDCDLCIPLKTVSRRHCQLNQNKEAIKIRDLGSGIGTFLNGKRIEEATLKAGDYIRIGPLIFLLQINGQPEKIVPPKPTKPQPAKPKPVKKEIPKGKALAEELSGSFPEMEIDGSDSFLNELEDL